MHPQRRAFSDLYAQGFARVAVAVPRVFLADPRRNAAEIEAAYVRASEGGAVLALFPELALGGYSLDDLHQQDALLAGVLEGLERLRAASEERGTLLIVGAPLRLEQKLFNAAVILQRGRVLGLVPKSYLPNYREFYEKRQFASARDALSRTATVLGQEVPFGNDLVLRARSEPRFVLHVEVCEDVWVPIPPSTYAALAGATVLCNLSASNVTVGKAGYRRMLAGAQSAKGLAAYLYAAAGEGESTTDLAWDGHAMVYENGELLAESQRFAGEAQVVFADLDLDRLVQERARMTSFFDCAADHRESLARLRTLDFELELPKGRVELGRKVARRPYVPDDPALRDERCREAYEIQVSGLVQRLRATSCGKLVIGVSGGIDSTHALLVCCQAVDRLGLPRENVLAYSMPGFATSTGTRDAAWALMRALHVKASEIDIRPACEQMLRDIGHPASRGEAVHDVTFENVQAGERTSHLFRLANLHRGIVVGTGDLSELALGWCTYGVGDHMAHYSVNASIPKTLIRHLADWYAERVADADTAAALRKILAMPSSPELVPGKSKDAPEQSTEATIGPFDLHDFFLYYTTRRGYSPTKVAYLAAHAWTQDGQKAGDGTYSFDEVLRWLEVFLRRFFELSQFKRSCLPNAPKVGSGGSLSPRGDWRAPSDSSAAAWLEDLARAREWAKERRQK